MVGQRQNCPDSERLMPGGTRQIQACLNTWYKLLSGVLVSDLSAGKEVLPEEQKALRKKQRMPRCTCVRRGSSQRNESSKTQSLNGMGRLLESFRHGSPQMDRALGEGS